MGQDFAVNFNKTCVPCFTFRLSADQHHSLQKEKGEALYCIVDSILGFMTGLVGPVHAVLCFCFAHFPQWTM